MRHGLPGAIAHRRKRLRLHLQRSEKAELHLAAEWINGKALITQNDYTPPSRLTILTHGVAGETDPPQYERACRNDRPQNGTCFRVAVW